MADYNKGTGFFKYGNDPEEVMLGVIIDKEHDVDIYSYLHGICGVFALALAQTYGYRIRMFCDANDAPTLENLIHVYCVPTEQTVPTHFIDARGITTNEKLFVENFEGLYFTPIHVDVDAAELEVAMRDMLGNEGYEFFLDCAKKFIAKVSYYKYIPKDYIWDRDKIEIGVIKNLHSRPCRMEGCTGMRMHVVWPDGKATYPCSKGCIQLGEHLWKID